MGVVAVFFQRLAQNALGLRMRTVYRRQRTPQNRGDQMHPPREYDIRGIVLV